MGRPSRARPLYLLALLLILSSPVLALSQRERARPPARAVSLTSIIRESWRGFLSLVGSQLGVPPPSPSKPSSGITQSPPVGGGGDLGGQMDPNG